MTRHEPEVQRGIRAANLQRRPADVDARTTWNGEFRAISQKYGYSDVNPHEECWDEDYMNGLLPEEAIQRDIEDGQ